ncbi:MAG: type II toxin-antitoxin system HicB family antitoxin [Planctomycetes bacterium]|nr:type II toxin-antitoxin system HicB family antitoxin [Planctomycetota bacterium]
MKPTNYLFPIMVECLEEGGYYAECPVLQGCHVEGDTYAEAVENLEDAIRLFLKSYRELGKPLPAIPRIQRRTAVTGGIPMAIREVS